MKLGEQSQARVQERKSRCRVQKRNCDTRKAVDRSQRSWRNRKGLGAVLIKWVNMPSLVREAGIE